MRAMTLAILLAPCCGLLCKGSADPLDQWTLRNQVFPTNISPSAITFGSDRFMVAGWNSAGTEGVIVTSSDGVTWTQQYSGVGYPLGAIAYGSGQFVAVGGAGTIVSSPDGVGWTQRNHLMGADVNVVAYGRGKFVAVGPAGVMLESAPMQPKLGTPRLLVDGTLQGTVDWLPGQSYRIETSPDLTNWLALTNVTSTNATAQFSDSAAATSKMRFYRAVSP